jgi:MYXO-CTERM domain-containing protein
VSCQDLSFDLGVQDVAGLADPCAGVTCGAMGSCRPLNGGPTCLCPPDYAAVNIGGTVTCSLALETYLASQLLWPDWPPQVDTGDDDDTTSGSGDDDTVADDDDDDGGSGVGGPDSFYEGLDSGVSCACASTGSGSGAGGGLALLALLALGVVRRRD